MNTYITQADVLARIAFPSDFTEGNPAITSAIAAAHLRVKSILDTELDKVNMVDEFSLDRDQCQDRVPNGMFRLRLRNGLLRAAPVPVVSYGESYEDLQSAPQVLGLSYDPATSTRGCKIDYLKGIVYVPESYEDGYVSVAYTSGYNQGEQAHDAIKEALIALIPVVINLGNLNDQVGARTGNVKKRQEIEDHVVEVLLPLRRSRVFTLDPVY